MDCVYVIKQKLVTDSSSDYSGDYDREETDKGILKVFKTEEECVAYLKYEGYYLSHGNGWMKRFPYSQYYSCEIEKLPIDTFTDYKTQQDSDKRRNLQEQKVKLEEEIDKLGKLIDEEK
jgi:hypothetical protein